MSMAEMTEAPELELELELDGRVEVCALTGGAADMVRAVVDRAIAGLGHGDLPGRAERGQHPAAAIEGLEKELERIPAPAEALTNFELEEILK